MFIFAVSHRLHALSIWLSSRTSRLRFSTLARSSDASAWSISARAWPLCCSPRCAASASSADRARLRDAKLRVEFRPSGVGVGDGFASDASVARAAADAASRDASAASAARASATFASAAARSAARVGPARRRRRRAFAAADFSSAARSRRASASRDSAERHRCAKRAAAASTATSSGT